jgi:hypothetical protein
VRYKAGCVPVLLKAKSAFIYLCHVSLMENKLRVRARNATFSAGIGSHGIARATSNVEARAKTNS